MDSAEEARKELHGLRENLGELAQSVDALIRERGIGSGNTSAAQINVNGGTWASYIALALVLATLCVVALACLFVAFQLSDLRRQDETFQAYINAGYVQPPKEEDQK